MTVVYVDSKGDGAFHDALKSLRPGDELAVVRLADLASNRRELRKRLGMVHAKRCSITEKATGRNSKKTGALDMIFDAMEMLTHSGKGHDPDKAREFGSRGGRPRKDRGISDADARVIWKSLDYATNAEALKHMGKFNETTAQRRFGPSGRVTGPRRRLKPKPKARR